MAGPKMSRREALTAGGAIAAARVSQMALSAVTVPSSCARARRRDGAPILIRCEPHKRRGLVGLGRGVR